MPSPLHLLPTARPLSGAAADSARAEGRQDALYAATVRASVSFTGEQGEPSLSASADVSAEVAAFYVNQGLRVCCPASRQRPRHTI